MTIDNDHYLDKERHVTSALAVLKTMTAVQHTNNLLQQFQPDIIFYPERGAIPIKWAIDAITNNQFSSHNLVIGSAVFESGGRKGFGPNIPEKKAIIQEAFDILSSMRPPLEKIAIVDEVQTGSTWSEATKHVYREAVRRNRPTEILSIGIADGKKEPTKTYFGRDIRRYHTSNYRDIPFLQGTTKYLPQTKLALFLDTEYFVIDKPYLLNRLILPEGEKRYRRVSVIENLRAKELLQLFSHCIINHPLPTKKAATILGSLEAAALFEPLPSQLEKHLLQEADVDDATYHIYERLRTTVRNNTSTQTDKQQLEELVKKRLKWFDQLSQEMENLPQVIPIDRIAAAPIRRNLFS